MRPEPRSRRTVGVARRDLLLGGCAAPLGLGAFGLLAAAGPATAQAPVSRRSFDGLAFAAVRHELPGRLELRPASATRVTVQAERAVLDALRIRVEAGELLLAAAGFRTREPVTILVEFTTLERLTLVSSGDAALDPLRAERLQVKVEGSGDWSAQGLNLSQLSLDSSGSGTVRLSGRARVANVRLSGSGDLDAESFAVQRVDLDSTGSGDAHLQATQVLNVALEGSGNVRCKGRPRLTRRGQGSGDVACGT